MAGEKKNIVQIPIEIQISEKKEENHTKETANNEDTSSDQPAVEMPTVTTLLQRKKLTIASVSTQTPKIEKKIQPPVFRKKIMTPQTLNINALKTALLTHKDSSDMKKLDCLSYFLTRFQQIIYFETSQSWVLKGVLGYGLENLTMGIKGKLLLLSTFPSISKLTAQGEVFVGPVTNLKIEDRKGLEDLGFRNIHSLGAFPISNEGKVMGIWICASSQALSIPLDEIQTLKKLFTGLRI